MTDKLKPDETQVDTTAISKGKITVFGNINNPTPTILARATKALRYFCVAIIGLVSGSDLFTGNQSKVIIFCLAAFIILLGAIDIAVGVEPEKEKS